MAPAAAPAARRGRQLAPKYRSGKFGFMDPDDPDFESVVRAHAAETGQDPDALMRSELATRLSGGSSRSLDEVLADERAKAPKDSSGPSSPANPDQSASRPSPVLGRVAAAGPSGDGAGLLLGLLAYALAVNYLRGGPAQARGWLAAKFLNKPMGGK